MFRNTNAVLRDLIWFLLLKLNRRNTWDPRESRIFQEKCFGINFFISYYLIVRLKGWSLASSSGCGNVMSVGIQKAINLNVSWNPFKLSLQTQPFFLNKSKHHQTWIQRETSSRGCGYQLAGNYKVKEIVFI